MAQSDHKARDRLKKLDPNEWRAIIEQLTLYAYHKTLKRYWVTPKGSLPEGREAEDIALGAILKVLSGVRRWDPERSDLLHFLKTVVDSETNHLVHSYENLQRVRAAAGEADFLNSTVDTREGPEQEALAEETLDRMRRSLADDEVLLAVFNSLIQGKKPKQIGSELGYSSAEVYQLVRKLRRRLHSIDITPDSYRKEVKHARES